MKKKIMKIYLDNFGKHTLVDMDDFIKYGKLVWYCNNNGYVCKRKVHSSKKQAMIYLHREIMQTPKRMVTDHKNMDKTDNRKENLRVCTNSENMRNTIIKKNNTSGYKGVYFHSLTNKWHARIGVDGICINLGFFIDKIKAVNAYNMAAIKYHGEFARLNKL